VNEVLSSLKKLNSGIIAAGFCAAVVAEIKINRMSTFNIFFIHFYVFLNKKED